MTKKYRFIQRVEIEDETYLPGVFAPDSLDIEKLLECGCIAEYKHGKKAVKIPVKKLDKNPDKKVVNYEKV